MAAFKRKAACMHVPYASCGPSNIRPDRHTERATCKPFAILYWRPQKTNLQRVSSCYAHKEPSAGTRYWSPGDEHYNSCLAA